MSPQSRRSCRFLVTIPLFVACPAPQWPATGTTESTTSPTGATETNGMLDPPTDPAPTSSTSIASTSTTTTSTTTTAGSTGVGGLCGDFVVDPGEDCDRQLAFAQDSTFTRLLRKNQYPLTQNGKQFTGSGWEKLLQDVRKSQVVLVGEDHGTAQTPAFTAALAREFKPATFVAEIDPYQAQDLARLADQPGLPVAFQQQHPMGLSFYSWTEEFELAQALRSQKVQFLGIDQVNCFATGRFYGRLAELTTNKATQNFLRRRAAVYQAHDRQAFDAGLERLSILQQSPASLDSLVSLTRKESPAVQQMVQQYRTSAGIYQAQVHQERVNLMRRNLLQGLHPVASPPGPPLPKVLIKMGAVHIARGATLLGGTFDVGNLALSLAEAQDQKSLHILVAGKQGTKLAGFSLADVRKNVVTYSNAEEAFVQPFPVPAGSTAWQVFDLRPLRRALLNDKLKPTTNDLATVLLGYDYVIIIPETTASRNF